MKVTLTRIPEPKPGDVTKQIFRDVEQIKWDSVGVVIRTPYGVYLLRLAPMWRIDIDDND